MIYSTEARFVEEWCTVQGLGARFVEEWYAIWGGAAKVEGQWSTVQGLGTRFVEECYSVKKMGLELKDNAMQYMGLCDERTELVLNEIGNDVQYIQGLGAESMELKM